MKKVLIVLLSVLLALSFVSCEKDKSEEIIANYEAFVKTCPKAEAAVTTLSFNTSWYSETGKIDNSFSDTSLSEDDYWYVATLINNLEDNNIYSSEIVSATLKSGNLTGQRNLETKETDVTASDVVLEVTYKPDASSDKTETAEFKMNGDYKKCNNDDYNEMKCDLTVNGIKYNIAYKVVKGDNPKYTSAAVDGKDVEIRLLNATLSL